MDNTELHYVTYDPEAIWDEMQQTYIEAGGDLLYPGDEKEMLLRSVQADIVQVLAGVDNGLRMATLRYAAGEYLDLIGENRWCTRIAASKATARVSITTLATGTTGTLPAGTSMTADGEMYYLTTEDIALTGYAQTITTTIEADRTGSAGNGLLSGFQMSLAVPNPSIAQIVVAEDASGGNEAEEDEAYRDRIRNHGLTAVTTGTKAQYRSVAMSVSSAITDAAAIKESAGNVTVYLIIDTEDESEEIAIMRAVASAMEENRPLTDYGVVSMATDVPYTLNVQYQSDGSTSTIAAITEATEAYQDEQDNEIGRAFNPDKLMAAIYQAGATRVIWGSGSSFNGGSVEYTTIEPNERCKGTITLTAI